MALTPIVIVEPHADDAFLSLGGHLLAWQAQGRRTAIVTVFPQTERRAREGRAYADSVEALYSVCTADLDDGPEALADELTEVLHTTFGLLGTKRGESNAIVVGPLGLKHPEHRLVFDAIDSWVTHLPELVAFYVDTPYQTVQRNGLDVLHKMVGRRVLSFYMPPVAKWKAVPIFKSQAKFFHFNAPERLRRVPEIILGSDQRLDLGDGVRIWHTAQ